jgi:glycosyltransferase involved in cell wall biosynthesis
MKLTIRNWLKTLRSVAQHTPRQADFDAQAYLNENPDVAAARFDAWDHYVRHGAAEGRRFPSKRELSETARELGNEHQYCDPSGDLGLVAGSGYFDPEWYLEKNPDLRGRLPPLDHFMRFGVWEGRDPGPFFNTTWYWEQYPDIKGSNPLIHYLRFGISEGRIPAPPDGAIDAAAELFASVRKCDSGLNAVEQFEFFKAVPFYEGRRTAGHTRQLLQVLLDRTPRQCTHFIFVPWLVLGGAERVTVNFARAAEKIIGCDRLAIVVADHARLDSKQWLPVGVHIINIASVIGHLSFEDKLALLEKYVAAVRPKKLLNNNSLLMWTLMRDRGRILRQHSDIYACMFCRDYNRYNNAAGYADTHLRDAYDNIVKIYLDNATFKDDLIKQYRFMEPSTDKFAVLRQPLKTSLLHRRPPAPLTHKSVRVLWASRLVKQKNYKLLAAIVNGSPTYLEFDVWGAGGDDAIAEFRSLTHSNRVNLRGAYPSFESLPLEEYDVYLYTSLWDGIPNAVLEAAAYGFPTISSNVGGIAEVISEERGWLLDPRGSASEYIAAINEIHSDKTLAWKRGTKLRDFVSERHTLDGIVQVLEQSDHFLGNEDVG